MDLWERWRLVEPKQADNNSTGAQQLQLAWPEFPQMINTLLAAAAVAASFLGIGTLVQQPWLTWLGLVVAAAVLASHLVRYQRVLRARQMTREMLDAELMSRCRGIAGPRALGSFYGGQEFLLLVLSADALLVASVAPLRIVSTIPLYTIVDADASRPPQPPAALHIVARMSGNERQRFIFSDFERGPTPDAWASALRRSVSAS